MKNNICIYVFYEKNGIVRNYVNYYLKALTEITSKIIVVVNGKISEKGLNTLNSIGNIEIIQRENNGLDFGAWKETINKIGYENLEKFDNLILTNTTCYGPVYPILDMYNEMMQRDCDFWGITKHTETNENVIEGKNSTKIIEHLQSYFLVFNKKVFLSQAFKDFWKNIKIYNDYNKVVGYYEIKLTRYLENSGFKSDSYIKTEYHDNYCENPLLITYEMLKFHHLPFIKRKAICCKETLQQINNTGQKIINYIEEETNYPSDYIYEDIINTYSNSEIKRNLGCGYILSEKFSNKKINKKIALVLHIYYEDLIEYCLSFVKSMPENSDIYIVSPKQTILDKCELLMKTYSIYNIIYRLKENRGRDLSAYLVTCSDVFKKYDYVCCMHDKKSPHATKLYGYNFMKHCFTNILNNRGYVENILNIFEQNKHIGMLYPPQPLNTIGNELENNLKNVKKLYKMLDLKIPFDNNPVAPFGSMFWIRGNAIMPLFRHKWDYTDFPKEPMPNDGTISHAIERIFPYIVQESGYISTWVMTDEFAKKQMENLCYCNLLMKPIKYNLIERIFSVKYEQHLFNMHKVYSILGFKIKIKKKA